MKLRLSQKPGTHTPSSEPNMSARSHTDPRWAAATTPEGTPIATATRSAHAISTRVGSVRSTIAVTTGRSRKYDWPRSPRSTRP